MNLASREDILYLKPPLKKERLPKGCLYWEYIPSELSSLPPSAYLVLAPSEAVDSTLLC